jgi:23S rRNA pseudouridine2457 synthase
MSRLILLNKPHGVLCQFTSSEARPTLADLVRVPDVYPAGRLDADSEGLLLLTDDGALQARIADPRHKLPKTYWVQVEGEPSDGSLAALRRGVALGDGPARPARVRRIAEPALWERVPPIRVRRAIPTAWLELTITEGRNRQVRRMTAAVGLPTLRLVRVAVGPWRIEGLAPGEWREVEAAAPEAAPGVSPRASGPAPAPRPSDRDDSAPRSPRARARGRSRSRGRRARSGGAPGS